MTAKLVERLPAWRKTIQDADNDPKLLEAFDRSVAAIANRARGDSGAEMSKEDAKRLASDLIALPAAVERKYRVPVATEWYGFVGNAMSTPVSDGARVYVVYGQCQVAAYDLDGHLVWGKRFAQWEPGKRGTCNLSPLLCDHVLIIKSPTGLMWRALDARTGTLTWERKDAVGYQYTPARLVRLYTAQGAPVNAVLYPNAPQIRRAEDDRVLGEFPGKLSPGRGYHFLVHRDLVLFAGGSGDGKTKAAVVYRLRATATDRVDVERVYDLPDVRVRDDFPTATPEHIVLPAVVPLSLYPFAGGERRTTVVPLGGSENGTTVVAGTTLLSLLSADGGNNAWWRGPRPDGGGQGGQGRATDRKAMVRIVTADIADPAAVRILSERNLLQEAGPASDIYVEQYLKGIDPFLFAGCYHGSAAWFGGMMGSMTPSGNRLFIQSATHLRCIGDPAVPYDWNPASRSEAITRSLKKE